jgi:D-aminoacyl-tRNA deacylase
MESHMRAVVQRVKEANVAVNGETIGAIGKGLVLLLGIGEEDTQADAKYLVDKIAGLRIFADDEDKMNLSLVDVGGEVLVISQFTLFGDVRKGRRPSFIKAARPELAVPLYETVIALFSDIGVAVATGEFQAMMDVSLVNEGPVTILLDSKKMF